jgi:hypothetical protein
VSSIWKASVKTLIKLLSFEEVVEALVTGDNKQTDTTLDCNKFVEIVLDSKIDPIDHSEEEQKLLLK